MGFRPIKNASDVKSVLDTAESHAIALRDVMTQERKLLIHKLSHETVQVRSPLRLLQPFIASARLECPVNPRRGSDKPNAFAPLLPHNSR